MTKPATGTEAFGMVSLGRNSFWLLLARVTTQGLAVLLIAILARRIAVESFGQFTFIGAVVLIGNTFTNFGTDTYIVRQVAQTGRTVPLISSALGLQLILSALWWIVTLLLQPNPPLLIYSLALFPLALFSVAIAALRGFERMDLVWTLSLANGLLQVMAAFLSHDLQTLCFSLLAAHIAVAVLACWICSASLPEFKLIPFKAVYPLLKVTLPIAGLTLILVLSQRLGVLTVAALLGDEATGIFSSATRLVDGLKLGHYAVLGGLLPIISRGAAESKQSFRLGFLLITGLSLVIAAGLALFSRLVILLIFGASYVSAIPLLSMLGWSLLPYTVSSFISYDLIARHHESLLVKATAISLALFSILYVTLISANGLTGAVYAALIGETLQAILFLFIRRSVAFQPRAASLPGQ